MLIFDILLVGDSLNQAAQFLLLSTAAFKSIIQCTVLIVLFTLESVTNLGHFCVEISHHSSLLLSAQVASIELLAEVRNDLIFHSGIFVKYAIEGHLL